MARLAGGEGIVRERERYAAVQKDIRSVRKEEEEEEEEDSPLGNSGSCVF